MRKVNKISTELCFTPKAMSRRYNINHKSFKQECEFTVSVIIPALNAEPFIGRCLDSVFGQNHKRLEVIVIDDGSTDLTLDVIRKYGSRIIIVSQENQGPSSARNRGLAIAHGEFVAFLDADDYWLPEFISRCLKFFEYFPDADAVSTGQKIFSWDGKVSINPRFLQEGVARQEAKLLNEFFSFWAEHDHIRTGSCLFRRTLLQRAGYLQEGLRIGEDLEYWGYLATFGTWGFIPEVLWVGDPCAVAQGWFAKNQQRRKLCPTIDDWQQRLAPRLKDSDWKDFRVVRGRVAQAFAYAKLLGGDISGARHVAQHYGQEFPLNTMARIFRWLAPMGLTAWRAMSLVLIWREAVKSWNLRKTHYRSLGRISLFTFEAL